MRFVLASYGSRGDIEPCAAIGRELLRRGHDVRVAVPPDLVGFIESAGLAAAAYGIDTRQWIGVQRDFETSLLRHFWKIQELIRLGREARESFTQSWEQISATLMSLAEGGPTCWSPVWFSRGLSPTSRSFTTFRWPRCIRCRCGPTASSSHCSRRGWPAP